MRRLKPASGLQKPVEEEEEEEDEWKYKRYSCIIPP
jgi:hypothetical protein